MGIRRSLTIALAEVFVISHAFAGNVATPVRPPGEVVDLFNGTDLGGWYTFIKGRGKNADPKKVFSVDKRIIEISGKEWGCITTDKIYENYYLLAEWRWSGPVHAPREKNARDSGIVIHSVGEDGGYSGTWMHGIEVQIIEGGTGDFIVVGDGSDRYAITAECAPERQGDSPVYSAGGQSVTLHKGRINWWGRAPGWSDTLGFRGARDVEKKVGEWNQTEVFARGAEVIVFLNGVKVNQAARVTPAKGRIQIQSEGAAIEFRKIGLVPLSAEILK